MAFLELRRALGALPLPPCGASLKLQNACVMKSAHRLFWPLSHASNDSLCDSIREVF